MPTTNLREKLVSDNVQEIDREKIADNCCSNLAAQSCSTHMIGRKISQQTLHGARFLLSHCRHSSSLMLRAPAIESKQCAIICSHRNSEQLQSYQHKHMRNINKDYSFGSWLIRHLFAADVESQAPLQRTVPFHHRELAFTAR